MALDALFTVCSVATMWALVPGDPVMDHLDMLSNITTIDRLE